MSDQPLVCVVSISRKFEHYPTIHTMDWIRSSVSTLSRHEGFGSPVLVNPFTTIRQKSKNMSLFHCYKFKFFIFLVIICHLSRGRGSVSRRWFKDTSTSLELNCFYHTQVSSEFPHVWNKNTHWCFHFNLSHFCL